MFAKSRNQHFFILFVIFFLCVVSGCNYVPPPSCNVNFLIASINNANATPATIDTIDLPAGCTYTLTNIDNGTWGSNGLPVITSPIIINGNGSTIQRDTNAVQFRLFYVSSPNGDLTLNNLTLTGGRAYNPVQPNDVLTNSGGAILNSDQLAVNKTTIKENSAREGGGVYNLGHMTLLDVTVDSNQDYFGLPGGAGIFNKGIGIITNSTISHNGFNQVQIADGIFNAQGGNLEMINSTVSGNAACGIDNEGDLVLNHVTIAFNPCVIGSTGDVYTSNSILADGGCGGTNNFHPIYPNFSTHSSCPVVVVPAPALGLDPLAHNGGTTKTHALRAGSVAIDKVVRMCLPTDQRHTARPFGPKCDVGAYEYVGTSAPLLNATDTPTPTVTPTSEPKACIFTAKVNLFCRSGPGASIYPDVDSFTPGQSAQVIAQSPDGVFAYVNGPNINVECVVPLNAKFGTLEGDCDQPKIFTPPVLPEVPSIEEGSDPPSLPGCTVRQLTGALSCVVPCPPDANPGDPCSP